MMKMANKTVFSASLGLGLTIAMCWPDGTESGILVTDDRTPSGRPIDLKAYRAGHDHQNVEALTPDGQAFLELMS